MMTLVVSRDSAARMFVEDVLRSFGYSVEVHKTADAAWESYERNAPSLAIVDLTLPQQSGFDLCRRMRASVHGASGMIVALAAGSRTSDLQDAVEAGVDDYVWRPIDGRMVRLRLAVAEQRLRVRRERIRTERQLREREERYRVLFDVLPDAVLMGAFDGRILDCNRAACELYGFSRQEMIGRDVRDFLPSDMRGLFPALIGQNLCSESSFRRTRNLRKDGTEFSCEVATRLVTIGDERRTVLFVRGHSLRAEKVAGA